MMPGQPGCLPFESTSRRVCLSSVWARSNSGDVVVDHDELHVAVFLLRTVFVGPPVASQFWCEQGPSVQR